MILLIFITSTLSAAIFATYTSQPSPVFEIGDSTIFPDGNLVAELGTMTIYSDKNTSYFNPFFIFTPSLSSSFTFTGDRFSWEGNGVKYYQTSNFSFRLVALRSISGVLSTVDLTSNPYSELVPVQEGNLLGKLDYIKIYLVSWEANASSIFHVGTSYTLSSGTLSNFDVAVAKSSSGFYGNNYYISINSQDLPQDGSMPLPGIPLTANPYSPFLFAGTIVPVSYNVSIINDTAFTIDQAYGAAKATIASTELTLANGISGTNYGVYITFANALGDTTFNLHLDGALTGYAIPYTLILGTDQVTGSTPILWDGLSNGANLKDISVTAIDSTTALMAPEGLYSDTISVNITPIDTI